MNCKCITTTNDRLREQNLKLTGYSFLMPGMVSCITISTDWIDKDKAPKGQKKRPTHMLASFCPFCGTKIDHPKEEEAKPAEEPKDTFTSIRTPQGTKSVRQRLLTEKVQGNDWLKLDNEEWVKLAACDSLWLGMPVSKVLKEPVPGPGDHRVIEVWETDKSREPVKTCFTGSNHGVG